MKLPTWCDTRIGRALVAAIIDGRPGLRVTTHRLPSHFGGYPDGHSVTYSGKLAARLRRIHSEWEERELAERERRGDYDRESAAAIFLIEQPDALIERVLAETEHHRRAA